VGNGTHSQFNVFTQSRKSQERTKLQARSDIKLEFEVDTMERVYYDYFVQTQPEFMHLHADTISPCFAEKEVDCKIGIEKNFLLIR